MDDNMDRVRWGVAEILKGIGEDPSRDGLLETPARVARAYAEMFSGYHEDPADLFKTFENDGHYDEMVIVAGIPFTSFCEHHILPFVGCAHIGYIPTDRIIGLSKIPRLVDIFAHRLQVQERLTAQIADALQDGLEPRGLMVVIEAEHTCMSMRGVRKTGTRTITSAVRGVFLDPSKGAREEFLQLIGKGG